MDILLADRSHIPLIAALERDTFSEPWSEHTLELFFGDGGFCAVCMEGAVLASYCTVVTVLDEAQIVNVATSIDHQRQGLARSVLKFVIDECLRRGLAPVSLEVREGNMPAILLYEGLGFERVGIRKNFYKEPRENALIMIKRLD